MSGLLLPRRANPLRTAVLFLLATFSVIPLLAQGTAAATQEPQYVNQFFRLGSDGTLVPLERQKLGHEMKGHSGFMSHTTTSDMAAPGPASSVRVPASSHFVVKMNTGDVDPATLISLKPFVVVKQERTLPQMQAKASAVPFAGVRSKSQSAPDSAISISIKKFGQGSFEIVPSQPLPPGEYVLQGAGGPYGDVSCFGVDSGG